MKQIITILISIITFSIWSQNPDKIQQKIKHQKIAFITERLELTSEEAEKFWPIYNSIETQKATLRKTASLKRKAKSVDRLTEKEAEILLNDMLEIQHQKYKLQKQLFEKLQGIVSNKKIVMLLRVERDFDRKLLKRFREAHKTKSKQIP